MPRSPRPQNVSARSPRSFRPEPLEGRVLLSGVVSTDVTTVAVADFTGDSASDRLVFARPLQARVLQAQAGIADTRPRSSLFILDGTTGGVVGRPIPLPSVTAAPIVVVDDFNGDGRNDLLIANGSRGGLELSLARRNGTFARPRRVSATVVNITSVSVADVNGDGFNDLVVAGESLAATAPRIRTLVPDFGAQVQDSGGLVPPPALAGGVTAEAGGAAGSIRRTNPALAGLDLSGLVGVGADAVLTGESSTGGSATGSIAGTFQLFPGAQGEAGGGTSPFGNNLVVGTGGGQVQQGVFVLFGNGRGTFSAGGSRRGR